MFSLVNLIISLALAVVDSILGLTTEGSIGLLGSVYGLVVLLPTIAVSVRRLHDTGRSGWWLLIAFIPLIGVIVLIIFFVQDSQPGANQYGPNPKGGDSGQEAFTEFRT